MDAEKRRLRDEVAELAEAVRDLRQQIARQAVPHYCYGCHYHHAGWHPPYVNPPYVYGPYTVTCGSGNVSATPVTTGTISYDSVVNSLPGTVTYSNLS